MPTKKVKKQESTNFDIQKLMKNSDSYKSLIYGIVTVVVLFIVIALGVRTLSQNKAEIDNQAAISSETNNVLTDSYIVSEGETLWSIAQKSYNDGYSWVEIAKANNLKEPYVIEKGQTLIIPKITPRVTPVAEISETVVPTGVVEKINSQPLATTEVVVANQKISGNSYKIVSGDNLWDIAVRAYGDGYRWVEIAKLNELTNPDLIFSGNVLRLPRP